jgi:hypothetical protein
MSNMKRNKDGDWRPSIRKIGSRYYIDMEEIETFFEVRAEMRSQELDDWFSNNDLDDQTVMEVGAEIDGSMEELDYLKRVFNYLRNSHALNSVKTIEDLEKVIGKKLTDTP